MEMPIRLRVFPDEVDSSAEDRSTGIYGRAIQEPRQDYQVTDHPEISRKTGALGATLHFVAQRMFLFFPFSPERNRAGAEVERGMAPLSAKDDERIWSVCGLYMEKHEKKSLPS